MAAGVALARGDAAVARASLSEVYAHMHRHHPDDYVTVHVSALLSLAQASLGNAAGAAQAGEAAVALAREFPAPRIWVIALVRAAEAALLTDRRAQARELVAEALLVLRDLGSVAWAGETLELAGVAIAQSDPATASLCLGAARALPLHPGDAYATPALAKLIASTAVSVASVLGDSVATAARRRGAEVPLPDMLALARDAVLSAAQARSES